MVRVRVALVAAVAVLGTTAVVSSAAPAPGPRPALAGDFDGDGLTDLYRPGAGSAYEKLQFSTGDGRTFASEQVPLTGTFTDLVGDFDGDRRDDVLHFNPDGPDAIWYGGADRGMSRVPVSASGGSTPVVGDFDGDGYDDVYWAGPGRGSDQVWYGAASRKLTMRSVKGITGRPVVGDYDGDRRSDILWIGSDTVWYGAARGSFTVGAWDVPSRRKAVVGDFDGNGASDVFWYGPGSAVDWVDYGSLARLPLRATVDARGTYDTAVGDFDGDRVDDVLLNGSGTDYVWYGTRLRTFDAKVVRTSAAGAPAVGDLNGDGRDDLFFPDTSRIWRGALDRVFASVKARETPNRVPVFDRANFRPYGYVAHAMGRIDGHAYTNSRDAFEASFSAGFRLYEVDLLRLRDGRVIAAHDRTEHWLGLKKRFRDATIEDVRGKKWMGKYDLLTADDLIALLTEHRDVYFILDTKWDHAEIVRTMMRKAVDPQVARRMLPHVTGQEDLDAMRRHYPVQHYVLALYRTQWQGQFDDAEVVSFVRRNDTPAVMMWIGERNPRKTLAENSSERRRYTTAFDNALRREGAVTYVHSTSDTERMEDFEARGVGVYSDGAFGKPVPPLLPVPMPEPVPPPGGWDD